MAGIALAGAAATAIGAGVSAATGSQAAGAQKQASLDQLRYQLAMYNEAKDRMRAFIQQGRKGLKGQAALTGQYAQNLPGWTDPAQYQKYLDVIQGAMNPYTQAEYQQSPLYTPMVNSLAELQATPGYQFQLQQGLQSVNNSAAARGGLLSGAQMKAINNFAQGQAATGFQNAWQRAQTAYQNAFANRQAQGQMAATGLQAQQGLNQQAAGLTAQGANMYGGMVNTGLNATGQLNEMAQNAANQGTAAIGNYGNAAAAGYYNTGQAINRGLQGMLGAYGAYQGASGMANA